MSLPASTAPAPAAKSAKAPTFEDSVRLAGRWFICGSSAVGFALGWFVGMSDTPVVGVLLPLLLAGIGGGSGMLVARTPLESAVSAWRLRCVGLATLLFAGLAVFGALIGVSVREGFLPVPGWPARGDELAELAPLELEGLPMELQAQLIVLREKLSLVKAEEPERNAVLNAALEQSKESLARKQDRELDVNQVITEARVLAQWAADSVEALGQDDEEASNFLESFSRAIETSALNLDGSADLDPESAVYHALHEHALSELDSLLTAFDYEAPLKVEQLLAADSGARRTFAILSAREAGLSSGPGVFLEEALSTLDAQIRLRATVVGGVAEDGGLDLVGSRSIASNEFSIGSGTVDG